MRSATIERQVANAVSGHEIVKRYGHGATAVEALRGVSVDFERGRFTAIMGPSGSDRRLTLMRRHEIGFVFQAYNLLDDRREQRPAELSGGEQQGVAAAGALIDVLSSIRYE